MNQIHEIKKNSYAFINRQFQVLRNNIDANKNLGIIASSAAIGSMIHPHTAIISGISMYSYNRLMNANSSKFQNPSRLFMGIGLGSTIPGAFRSIMRPFNVSHGKIWSELDHILTHESRAFLSSTGLVAESLLLSQHEEDQSLLLFYWTSLSNII